MKFPVKQLSEQNCWFSCYFWRTCRRKALEQRLPICKKPQQINTANWCYKTGPKIPFFPSSKRCSQNRKLKVLQCRPVSRWCAHRALKVFLYLSQCTVNPVGPSMLVNACNQIERMHFQFTWWIVCLTIWPHHTAGSGCNYLKSLLHIFP